MSTYNLERRPLDSYPLGTKAHNVIGGWWVKVPNGWQAMSGDIFPTPGGGVIRFEEPESPGA
jgi:hypothetical protein